MVELRNNSYNAPKRSRRISGFRIGKGILKKQNENNTKQKIYLKQSKKERFYRIFSPYSLTGNLENILSKRDISNISFESDILEGRIGDRYVRILLDKETGYIDEIYEIIRYNNDNIPDYIKSDLKYFNINEKLLNFYRNYHNRYYTRNGKKIKDLYEEKKSHIITLYNLTSSQSFSAKIIRFGMNLFIIPIFLIFFLSFAGCKGDTVTTPQNPSVKNSPVVLSLYKISKNYLGDNLLIDFGTSDKESDDMSGDVVYKILSTSGSLGSKILSSSCNDSPPYCDYVTDLYTIRIRGPPSYGGELGSLSYLSETGPFTLVIAAYDTVHDNTGTLTIDGLVEGYETTAVVFDGVNTPSVRISNEDYFEWSNGLVEIYLGGSPAEWQKNATNVTERQLVADNVSSDTDTSLSETYNNSDDWQNFINSATSGKYNVNFTRKDHTK